MLKTRFLGAVAALVLSAGVASAADLYRPAPVATPVAPTLIPGYIWTGGFVGVHAGYGWADFDGTKRFRGKGDADGFLAGVHGGFNWQYNALVVGADTNWSWTDFSGRSTFNGRNRNRGVRNEVNWAGDVRGRLGFAFDRFHLYGAAGVAFADIDVRGLRRNAGDTKTGWTAGLGAEFAVTNNFIVGAEWKYSDYGRVRSGDVTTNALLLKASWKF
jgi:outer membrane immunogenic protein